jgi:hypothetical protein
MAAASSTAALFDKQLASIHVQIQQLGHQVTMLIEEAAAALPTPDSYPPGMFYSTTVIARANVRFGLVWFGCRQVQGRSHSSHVIGTPPLLPTERNTLCVLDRESDAGSTSAGLDGSASSQRWCFSRFSSARCTTPLYSVCTSTSSTGLVRN